MCLALKRLNYFESSATNLPFRFSRNELNIHSVKRRIESGIHSDLARDGLGSSNLKTHFVGIWVLCSMHAEDQ